MAAFTSWGLRLTLDLCIRLLVAEETSLSPAQVTSLQLNRMCNSRAFTQEEGSTQTRFCAALMKSQSVESNTWVPSASTLESLVTAQLVIHCPIKLHLCGFGSLQAKVKRVSVPAGIGGFHCSEVWGAHTWVLCPFCLLSLEWPLENEHSSTHPSKVLFTHYPLHPDGSHLSLVAPLKLLLPSG